MKSSVRWIKYAAITLALLLAISIIFTLVNGSLSVLRGFGLMESETGTTGAGSDPIIERYTGELDTLSISSKANNLIIKTGDIFKIEGPKSVSTKAQDGKIMITDKQTSKSTISFFNKENSTNIIVTVPREISLKELKLDLDTGKSEISGIRTELLTITQGTGEIISKDIKAASGVLKAGAGKLEITESELHDFRLDASAGLIEIEGILTGKTIINAGAGKINMNIKDTKDNYLITVDKCIGAINIDDQPIPENGLGSESAPNKIDIDGSSGKVEIGFE